MRGPIPGLVVSTMQNLNGDREPGHRRCRRRGRMMRGDAAAVTGAVPAVSLAATPSRSSPAPCVAQPRLPWPWSPSSITTVGGFHTKLPDRAPVPQDVGPWRPDLVHDRPMARSRRSMERDVERRSWRSSSVAGAHSSATRTLLQKGVARRPHARRAAARDAARRCTRTYGWGAAGKRGEVARQGGTPRGSCRAK